MSGEVIKNLFLKHIKKIKNKNVLLMKGKSQFNERKNN